MCRDHDNDDGSTPSNPNNEAWWSSPDIWVRNAEDGIPAHQNPIAGRTNYIYVRVHNIGDATVDNITVHVYDSAGAVNLRWPDDWMPEIGTATIASLPAGQVTVVSVPWTPSYSGHYCFLTRIEAPDDQITFDGWVAFRQQHLPEERADHRRWHVEHGGERRQPGAGVGLRLGDHQLE